MKKMLSVFVVAMMCLVGSVSAEAANWISGNSDGSRLWDADSVYSKKNGDIFFYEKGIDTANNVTFIFDSIISANRGMVTYTYGRVYNANGVLVHEAPMAAPHYIDTLNNASMYRDIIAYCERNGR